MNFGCLPVLYYCIHKSYTSASILCHNLETWLSEGLENILYSLVIQDSLFQGEKVLIATCHWGSLTVSDINDTLWTLQKKLS